uniref:E4 protein n=1 Tax=Human papillomavirus TaxID=10566 RepID=A0A385PK90_9PAPI|nr:MAG: E4 protein [Human papillomavirus]
MACIMMKSVVIEYTLCCSIQMHKNMDKPEHGQCCLKTKLLLPPSALQALSLQNPGKTPPPFPQPPKSPYPPPRKAPDDSRGRRLGLVPGRKLLFDEDEDENKENLPPSSTRPPPQKDEEEEEEDLQLDLPHLLKTLGQDINQLQENILRDLNYFRKRLGIPQS